MDIMEVEMSLIEVEEDIFMDFKEEENCVVKFEWEKLVNTKEEDFRGDVNYPTLTAEQEQVS